MRNNYCPDSQLSSSASIARPLPTKQHRRVSVHFKPPQMTLLEEMVVRILSLSLYYLSFQKSEGLSE